MSLNIALPQSLSKSTSTKDLVVALLCNEWPLNANTIYLRMKKQHGSDVTYQAVHKTIKKLEEEGVIEKQGREYSISPKWLEGTRQFLDNVKFNYSNNAKNSSEEGQTNLYFDTLYEVDQFLFDFLKKQIETDGEKAVLCLHWNHFWIPLFLSRDDYAQLNYLLPFVKLYSLSRGNSPVDKWCADFWKKLFLNVKIGVDCASTSDLVIYKDLIVEVFYPEEIKQAIDKVFSSSEKVYDIDLNDFFKNVFEKKTKIPVVINKNPVLAEQLRKQTIARFNQH